MLTENQNVFTQYLTKLANHTKFTPDDLTCIFQSANKTTDFNEKCVLSFFAGFISSKLRKLKIIKLAEKTALHPYFIASYVLSNDHGSLFDDLINKLNEQITKINNNDISNKLSLLLYFSFFQLKCDQASCDGSFLISLYQTVNSTIHTIINSSLINETNISSFCIICHSLCLSFLGSSHTYNDCLTDELVNSTNLNIVRLIFNTYNRCHSLNTYPGLSKLLRINDQLTISNLCYVIDLLFDYMYMTDLSTIEQSFHTYIYWNLFNPLCKYTIACCDFKNLDSVTKTRFLLVCFSHDKILHSRSRKIFDFYCLCTDSNLVKECISDICTSFDIDVLDKLVNLNHVKPLQLFSLFCSKKVLNDHLGIFKGYQQSLHDMLEKFIISKAKLLLDNNSLTELIQPGANDKTLNLENTKNNLTGTTAALTKPAVATSKATKPKVSSNSLRLLKKLDAQGVTIKTKSNVCNNNSTYVKQKHSNTITSVNGQLCFIKSTFDYDCVKIERFIPLVLRLIKKLSSITLYKTQAFSVLYSLINRVNLKSNTTMFTLLYELTVSTILFDQLRNYYDFDSFDIILIQMLNKATIDNSLFILSIELWSVLFSNRRCSVKCYQSIAMLIRKVLIDMPIIPTDSLVNVLYHINLHKKSYQQVYNDIIDTVKTTFDLSMSKQFTDIMDATSMCNELSELISKLEHDELIGLFKFICLLLNEVLVQNFAIPNRLLIYIVCLRSFCFDKTADDFMSSASMLLTKLADVESNLEINNMILCLNVDSSVLQDSIICKITSLVAPDSVKDLVAHYTTFRLLRLENSIPDVLKNSPSYETNKSSYIQKYVEKNPMPISNGELAIVKLFNSLVANDKLNMISEITKVYAFLLNSIIVDKMLCMRCINILQRTVRLLLSSSKVSMIKPKLIHSFLSVVQKMINGELSGYSANYLETFYLIASKFYDILKFEDLTVEQTENIVIESLFSCAVPKSCKKHLLDSTKQLIDSAINAKSIFTKEYISSLKCRLDKTADASEEYGCAYLYVFLLNRISSFDELHAAFAEYTSSKNSNSQALHKNIVVLTAMYTFVQPIFYKQDRFPDYVSATFTIIGDHLYHVSPDVRKATLDLINVFVNILSDAVIKETISQTIVKYEAKSNWRSKASCLMLLNILASRVSLSFTELEPIINILMAASRLQLGELPNIANSIFSEMLSSIVTNDNEDIVQQLIELLTNFKDARLKSVLVSFKENVLQSKLDVQLVFILESIMKKALKSKDNFVVLEALRILAITPYVTKSVDYISSQPLADELLNFVAPMQSGDDKIRNAVALTVTSRVIAASQQEEAFDFLLKRLLSCQLTLEISCIGQTLSQILRFCDNGFFTSHVNSLLDYLSVCTSSSSLSAYLCVVLYILLLNKDEFESFTQKSVTTLISLLTVCDKYCNPILMRCLNTSIFNYSDLSVAIFLTPLQQLQYHDLPSVRRDVADLISGLLEKITFSLNDASSFARLDGKVSRSSLSHMRLFLISNLYVTRFDPDATVKLLALQKWKAFIINSPRTLKDIMFILSHSIIKMISQGNSLQLSIALDCLTDLSKNYSELISLHFYDKIIVSISDDKLSSEVKFRFIRTLCIIIENSDKLSSFSDQIRKLWDILLLNYFSDSSDVTLQQASSTLLVLLLRRTVETKDRKNINYSYAMITKYTLINLLFSLCDVIYDDTSSYSLADTTLDASKATDVLSSLFNIDLSLVYSLVSSYLKQKPTKPSAITFIDLALQSSNSHLAELISDLLISISNLIPKIANNAPEQVTATLTTINSSIEAAAKTLASNNVFSLGKFLEMTQFLLQIYKLLDSGVVQNYTILQKSNTSLPSSPTFNDISSALDFKQHTVHSAAVFIFNFLAAFCKHGSFKAMDSLEFSNVIEQAIERSVSDFNRLVAQSCCDFCQQIQNSKLIPDTFKHNHSQNFFKYLARLLLSLSTTVHVKDLFTSNFATLLLAHVQFTAMKGKDSLYLTAISVIQNNYISDYLAEHPKVTLQIIGLLIRFKGSCNDDDVNIETAKLINIYYSKYHDSLKLLVPQIINYTLRHLVNSGQNSSVQNVLRNLLTNLITMSDRTVLILTSILNLQAASTEMTNVLQSIPTIKQLTSSDYATICNKIQESQLTDELKKLFKTKLVHNTFK